MIFPRETVRIGTCLAVTNKWTGVPITYWKTRRPGVKFEGESWFCSRLSYHLNIAPIPRCPPNMKEGFVLHTCDHKWCIEPDHLYLGTQKQNIKDIWDRNPTIRSKLSLGQIGNQNKKGKKHTHEFREAVSKRMIGNKFSPVNPKRDVRGRYALDNS